MISQSAILVNKQEEWINKCYICNKPFDKSDYRKTNFYPPKTVCCEKCHMLLKFEENK